MATGEPQQHEFLFKKGARVRHVTRGPGTVTELMADGRTRVLFDDGDEHRYHPSSMHKIWADGSTPLTNEEMAVLLIQRKTRTLLGTRYVHSAAFRKRRISFVEDLAGANIDPDELIAAVKMQGAVRGWQVRGRISKNAPQTISGFVAKARKGGRRSINGHRLTKQEVALLDAAERGDTNAALTAHRRGAALSVQDEGGRTPVMCAADANQTITALMLLRCGGARTELKDKQGRSSLSYAIARENVPLSLALISNVCGYAGNTTDELAFFLCAPPMQPHSLPDARALPVRTASTNGAASFFVCRSERELVRLYKLLSGLDSVRFGRATAMLFLTDPEGTLLVLVRAVTAVRDKAARIEKREHAQAEKLRQVPFDPIDPTSRAIGIQFPITPPDPAHADPFLRQAEVLIRAAILSIFYHAKELAMPARLAKTSGALEAMADSDLAAAQALNRAECDRREVVSCILRASQSALTVAVNNECKVLLNQADLRLYFEELWGGQLLVKIQEDADSKQVGGFGKKMGNDKMGNALKRSSSRADLQIASPLAVVAAAAATVTADSASCELHGSVTSAQPEDRGGGALATEGKLGPGRLPTAKPKLKHSKTSKMPAWFSPSWADETLAKKGPAKSGSTPRGSQQRRASQDIAADNQAEKRSDSSNETEERHPFADFWIGAIVKHPKHGPGRVEHFMSGGETGVDKMRVEFDDGSTCAARITCTPSHLRFLTCALRFAADIGTTPRVSRSSLSSMLVPRSSTTPSSSRSPSSVYCWQRHRLCCRRSCCGCRCRCGLPWRVDSK